MCTLYHLYCLCYIDADFEVTAEMSIHDDVDDESTLDEEEALDERDDEEIDELQKVIDPLASSVRLRVLTLFEGGACMIAEI